MQNLHSLTSYYSGFVSHFLSVMNTFLPTLITVCLSRPQLEAILIPSVYNASINICAEVSMRNCFSNHLSKNPQVIVSTSNNRMLGLPTVGHLPVWWYLLL